MPKIGVHESNGGPLTQKIVKKGASGLDFPGSAFGRQTVSFFLEGSKIGIDVSCFI